MTSDQISADIQLAVSALSILYSLGQDITPAIIALYQTVFLKKALTDDQRAALLANHNALSSALQAPLAPPPSAGAQTLSVAPSASTGGSTVPLASAG